MGFKAKAYAVANFLIWFHEALEDFVVAIKGHAWNGDDEDDDDDE